MKYMHVYETECYLSYPCIHLSFFGRHCCHIIANLNMIQVLFKMSFPGMS